MARITNDQADRMGGGNSEWFQLKNDGDVARVQFMLNSIDDIPIFSAHKVEIGGKDRYVDCLRNEGDSAEVCPLCASGMAAKPVRFIVMYQLDDQKVKIWERGRQFISKLQGLINRYSPLKDHVFEIERHGRPGDTNTKYEIYPVDSVEPVDLEDIEMPDFEGGLILQKSFEDMEEYLDTGSFPSETSEPVSRRRTAAESKPSTPARRVPSAGSQTQVSRRVSRRSAENSDPVASAAPATTTDSAAPTEAPSTSRRGSRRSVRGGNVDPREVF